MIKTVQESCDSLGYSWEYIVSGAGHDACQLNHKFPTSMIFIPCVNGLSHNEAENITDELGVKMGQECYLIPQWLSLIKFKKQ